MNERKTPLISSRKTPRQARSAELVAAVLEAAIQVLVNEGARGFTTARVAERAGVSVGSLYQYFPNKASILFRLQSDEWRRTSELLRGILDDPNKPPRDRLRALVHAFLRSECEEAPMRQALNDAAPLYRDAPEAEAARAAGDFHIERFLREALPKASVEQRVLTADLLSTTLSEVGRAFSEKPRDPAKIEVYAGAMADMFCAWLDAMERSGDVSGAYPSPRDGETPMRVK